MKTNFLDFKTEQGLLSEGFNFVIGCDEVGVGPLAGPVVAAACVIYPAHLQGRVTKDTWSARIRDSKKICETERGALDAIIKEHCLAYAIGAVEPTIIDQINIHNAALKAMRIAVEQVLQKLDSSIAQKICLLIDGRFIINNLPVQKNFVEQRAIIKGDGKIISIAAASIIAKVHRDNLMKQFDKQFPLYGFVRHKGYGTREHYAAIKMNGVTEIHRRSFLTR